MEERDRDSRAERAQTEAVAGFEEVGVPWENPEVNEAEAVDGVAQVEEKAARAEGRSACNLELEQGAAAH